MTTEKIQNKVMQVVSEQLGIDASEITRESKFTEELNADSLDAVELVMEFEDEFELYIPHEDATGIKTVGDAIDYLAKKIGGAGVPIGGEGAGR